MINAIQTIDASVIVFIQESIRFGLLNYIMVFVTTIGNSGAVWIALGLALLISKKNRMAGFNVLIALLVCYIINDLVLKNIVARQRPFEVISGLKVLISLPSSYSFPSGHSCSSFAAAYMLTKCFGKKGALSYILAVLIAFSRLYVGVHFLSDILVGAALGTVGSAGVFWLQIKYIKVEKAAVS